MVSAAQGGTLTATLSSVSLSRPLTVKPTGALAFILDPNTVIGGNSSTGIVTLKCAAAPGGVVVTLTSGNTAVTTVPGSITIPAGETIGTFVVNTVTVLRRYSPTIRIKIGGSTKRASLTVNP